MSRISEALSGPSYREVEVAGVLWRLRILDPALAAQANVLLEMIGTITAERGGQARKPVDERRATQIQEEILCTCVIGAAPVETPMEPLTLVRRLEDAVPEKDRIWVGTLELATMPGPPDKDGRPTVTPIATALMIHVLQQVREAQDVLAPFRPQPSAVGAAGPNGDQVRGNAE